MSDQAQTANVTTPPVETSGGAVVHGPEFLEPETGTPAQPSATLPPAIPASQTGVPVPGSDAPALPRIFADLETQLDPPVAAKLRRLRLADSTLVRVGLHNLDTNRRAEPLPLAMFGPSFVKRAFKLVGPGYVCATVDERDGQEPWTFGVDVPEFEQAQQEQAGRGPDPALAALADEIRELRLEQEIARRSGGGNAGLSIDVNALASDLVKETFNSAIARARESAKPESQRMVEQFREVTKSAREMTEAARELSPSTEDAMWREFAPVIRDVTTKATDSFFAPRDAAAEAAARYKQKLLGSPNGATG